MDHSLHTRRPALPTESEWLTPDGNICRPEY
jgi:hypothetical protein